MHPGTYIVMDRIRSDVRHSIQSGPPSQEQILIGQIMRPIMALIPLGIFVPLYAARTFMERKENPLLAVFAHLLMLPVGYGWLFLLDMMSSTQELVAEPWQLVAGSAIFLWLTGLLLYDTVNSLYDSVEEEERSRLGLPKSDS